MKAQRSFLCGLYGAFIWNLQPSIARVLYTFKKNFKEESELTHWGNIRQVVFEVGTPVLPAHLKMIFCNDNLYIVITLKKIHKKLYFSELKLEISLNYWEQIVKINFLIWTFYMAFAIFIFFPPNYWIYNKLLINVS